MKKSLTLILIVLLLLCHPKRAYGRIIYSSRVEWILSVPLPFFAFGALPIFNAFSFLVVPVVTYYNRAAEMQQEQRPPEQKLNLLVWKKKRTRRSSFSTQRTNRAIFFAAFLCGCTISAKNKTYCRRDALIAFGAPRDKLPSHLRFLGSFLP